MFFVLAKMRADAIPKTVVSIRYTMLEAKLNFQTKIVIGRCTNAQTMLVERFAIHSLSNALQTLLKRYPLKVVSSLNAVMKDMANE